jgi:soluble lytic murein transglycosylase-like protein
MRQTHWFLAFLAANLFATNSAFGSHRLNLDRSAYVVGTRSEFLLAERYRPMATMTLMLIDKPYAPEVEQAARKEALDPALVHALIHVESRHRADALSPKGAVGLMQVLPETAERFGRFRLTQPEDNLRAGTRYLRKLMNQFDQRLDLALAAYNAGENAVIRHGFRIPPYSETRQYVPAVLRQYEQLKPAAPTAPLRTVYLQGTELRTDWKMLLKE